MAVVVGGPGIQEWLGFYFESISIRSLCATADPKNKLKIEIMATFVFVLLANPNTD